MRIGIFTDTYAPDINGVVSSEMTLMHALERMGHTVFLITNHPGVKVIREGNVLKLPGIAIKSLYGYKLSFPVNFKAEDLVAGMSLDVIHIQTDFGVGFFARQIAKNYSIPCVYTYHTMYEDYTHYVNPFDLTAVENYSKKAIRSLSRLLANTMQGVVAPSLKTKQTLQEYGVKAPIYVVPTGLNLHRFSPQSQDAEAVHKLRCSIPGVDENSHTVVFVGRIASEKSVEMLIEMMKKTQDENLHLILVGSGPEEDMFKEMADKTGVQDRIHFTGAVKAESIPLYYAAFDIFASPSLSETQGMTYLEALAAGKMICGRRDEVLDHLLEENRTGYYFDTAEELAQKLDRFFALSVQEREENIPHCIQKTIPYSDEVFARKILSVYEQAADDYKHTYVVEKIRPFHDFIHLTVQRDADAQPLKFFMPGDDFYELKIARDTKLDAWLVTSYLELQNYYAAYMRIKERLAGRDYSSRQVYDYAVKKLQLDEASARHLVKEMQEKSLLDDRTYAFDKADYWHAYGHSRAQITQKLYKAGIDRELIEQAVQDLDDESELKNAISLAKRLRGSIKEQSSRMKRKTIVDKLLAKGYSIEIARQASETLDIAEDDEEALMIAWNKARRMYSTLPEPKRSQKIHLYCLRKGFSSAMIDEVLEGEKLEN